MRANVSARSAEGRGQRNGLGVRPFRGWRLAPERVRDLAGRYSTPWDQHAGNQETAPEEAANVLRAWRRSGTIARDHEPMMYAYQQTGPRGTQFGLIAAVHLDSTLVSQEEPVPCRANGIARLLDVGGMNLDPLLLGYAGNGTVVNHLSAASARPPVAETLGADGQRHRLWPISDREAFHAMGDELTGVRAFIADGQHRHIAARHHRRLVHAGGHGPGPWDYVMALLVDVRQSPLNMAPVHRILPFANPEVALSSASYQFRIAPLGGGLRQWLRVLSDTGRFGQAFVVVTQREAYLLSEGDEGFVNAALRSVPPPLRGLQVSTLHSALIGALWRLPDVPAQVDYEVSAVRAVQRVREDGGLAVLLNPAAHSELRAAAMAGVRLPRKTASFGPKPHPGLVFRTIHDR